ncbi:amidophosphoribosyltransferase [Sinanaerobacter sp. ZZT-01]|uniref:amidophosphoribosyltransferase n=1 Tax=Sinanaerobacter sp. ZZT-01 TaxID=3111540 RepID=UPI002D7953DF|nr:amidophosphoribosyltransferase [Sinanaerobacter sp. ZZT-01]WRR94572.1 amidophosphoribosyltransferase [Sinanaerobacter sp. ZZT-01]
MGGLFGVVSKKDCVMDLFFGTDYHSHLGTKRGGMCVFGDNGFERAIHSIENAPFRTKFEKEVTIMVGTKGIGSISDGEPQPLTVFSRQGHYSIGTVGRINNKEEIVQELIRMGNNQFLEMSGGTINNTELVAALISTSNNIVEGIQFAQKKIEGSVTILILTEDCMYAARDLYGRTSMILGKKRDSICASSESFAFYNLGYKPLRELGPGEIVRITAEEARTVSQPKDKMRICTFLWTYFGYTTSTYEGKNVEQMRYRNGASIAKHDEKLDVDYVAGVPDSGTAHALGYANQSCIPYARPLIKYTPTWPRSFMPQNQKARDLIAKMKLVPVHEIINGKRFVLIDDSIVRGTQLYGTVKYLYENGAKEIHVRSACPPIMYGCKYLNFSRSVSDMDLITRRVIQELEGGEATEEVLQEYVDASTEKHAKMIEKIKEELGFTSLKYHELEDTLAAVGIDKCKLCTYCWNGKE